MANWFYYNDKGEKIAVTGGQLKGLAKAGVITPGTMVETEDGKTAPAKKVKGLTFAARPPIVKVNVAPSITEELGLAPLPDEPEPPPFVSVPPVEVKPKPIKHSQKALITLLIKNRKYLQKPENIAKVIGYSVLLTGAIAYAVFYCTSPIFILEDKAFPNGWTYIRTPFGEADGYESPTVEEVDAFIKKTGGNVNRIRLVNKSHFERGGGRRVKLSEVILEDLIGDCIVFPILVLADRIIRGHIVEERFQKKKDLTKRFRAGTTLLGTAVYRNRTDIVTYLLENGANVNKPVGGWSGDNYMSTPLHIAIRRIGNSEIINLLIANGADVNKKNSRGITPLHEAVDKGYEEITNILLVNGANVNARDDAGETPLYKTLDDKRANVAMASILIENGADVNLIANKPDVVQYSDEGNPKPISDLEYGGMYGGGYNVGGSLLHRAAERGFVEFIDLLIANGAEVNTKNSNGETPLHRAAVHAPFLSGAETIKCLIKNGADVNAKNNNSDTALHILAKNGKWGYSSVLIAAGADVNATNNNNRTASSLADEFQNIKLAEERRREQERRDSLYTSSTPTPTPTREQILRETQAQLWDLNEQHRVRTEQFEGRPTIMRTDNPYR